MSKNEARLLEATTSEIFYLAILFLTSSTERTPRSSVIIKY